MSLTPYVPETGEYYTDSQMTAIQTTNYTVQPDDVVILVDFSAADMDLNLPDPTLGRRVIKIVNTKWGGYGTLLHIKRFGSEKIGGTAATFDMWSQFPSGTLVSDLTDWHWVNSVLPSNS